MFYAWALDGSSGPMPAGMNQVPQTNIWDRIKGLRYLG